MAKIARLTVEMSVSLTPEISQALEVATAFVGMKPSQFARQALIEKMVRDGWMVHPMQHHINAAADVAKA